MPFCISDPFSIADYVTAIAAIGDSKKGLKHLKKALLEIDKNLEKSGKKLPYLLKYYKTTGLYEAYKAKGDQFSSYFDKQNLVPTPWEKLVEKNCKDEA